MKRFIATKLPLVFLCLICPAILPSTAFPQGNQIERHQWKGPVGKSGRLRIDNPFGDVRLRYGGISGEVEILSVMQQLRTDGMRLITRNLQTEDGLLILIEWDVKPGETPPPRPADDRSRADLAVLVPTNIEVEVDAPIGLIEAEGIHADLDLHTRSGRIRVNEHSGAVSASSDDGSIKAVLQTEKTSRHQVFTSKTGPVEIWVPADTRNTVVMRTSGTITSDFSINITYNDHEEPAKTAKAVLGKGGPEIRIESLRGPLSLRRVIVPKKTRN